MNALGFEVVTFSVAMEGIEALVSLQHDVVLVVLDVVMPSLDGIECMSIIREHPVVCNIPIYILSGVEDLHILNLCVENGANGIVSKPLRMETFRSISSLHGLQRGGRGIDDIHHRYPRCSEMCNNTLTCSCLLPELKLPQPLISRPSADERSSHSSRVSNYTGPPFSFILLDSNYQQYSFPSTQQTIKRTNTYLVLLPSICCIRLYERDGCMRYIKDLHDELIYNGDEVLCISADLPDALAVAKQLLSLPCDLLSDPGLSVGRLLLGDIDEYDATKVGIVYLNADGDIIYKWCSAVGFPTTILAWRAMSAATLLRGKGSVSSSGVVESESLNSEDHEQLAVTVVEPEEAVTVTGVKDCILLATLTGDAEAMETSFAGDNGPGNSSPPMNEVVQLVDESPKRREVLVVDDSKMFSKLASSQLEVTHMKANHHHSTHTAAVANSVHML
jgi:CheY-like chemotaxis protein